MHGRIPDSRERNASVERDESSLMLNGQFQVEHDRARMRRAA